MTKHTTIAVYFNSTKDIEKGKRNNSSPVTLFIIVCRDINCFFETNPQTILQIFIIAMMPPHIHNHLGISIAGNSLNNDTATKKKSAIVSNRLPNLLVLFVFLAIAPSTISLKPHRRYVIKNAFENAGKNNNKILPKIRLPVSIFAICFFICSPANSTFLIDPSSLIKNRHSNSACCVCFSLVNIAHFSLLEIRDIADTV